MQPTLTPNLTPLEKKVLDHLAANPGRVVSFNEWRDILAFRSGLHGRQNLYVLIWGIRRKIPGIQIYNENRQGYVYEPKFVMAWERDRQ